LEPVSPYYLVGGALPSLYAGRYPEAKRRLEQILEVDSSYSNTSYAMGVCELAVGRPDRAIELFRRALRQDDTPYIRSMLGYALARSGEVREAEDLAERIRNARDGASHSADLALVLAGLGRVDEAFDLLEHARSQHEEILFLLACAPYWRVLYTDPRFARLLDRLGLPHPPGVGTTTHS
jgi:tetratricopeptide (TPR) repeat protein